MEKLSQRTEAILLKRFSKGSLISLATSVENVPYVRTVDAFYVLTHTLSGKMKQIEKNPIVAVSGEWFTAHGRGINFGWFGSDKNKSIAEKMRIVFADWIDNGHSNFEDKNTIILRIELTKGVLFSDGIRYEIDFS
ncbi:MAG: pyridoxamine 5'-phosphate oxidase family protein [Clostridia bacterium]|nr:pyridoxamine 5'-phosphate oxidase family protein [Clostridia bacterium]